MTKKIEIELPVIPQQVADAIEEVKITYCDDKKEATLNRLNNALIMDFNKHNIVYSYQNPLYTLYHWYFESDENKVKLPRAILFGYKVDKEPLYYVKFFKDNNKGFLIKDLDDDDLFIFSKVECDGFKTKFTESEIKAIDERYWQFAVPVEEID